MKKEQASACSFFGIDKVYILCYYIDIEIGKGGVMRKLTKLSVVSLFAALFAAVTITPVKADANSAQRYWEGTSTTGAMIMDETCPVEVLHEKLVFDLKEFPSNYYQTVESFLAYTGKVSAEYTFFNPKDYTVKATLAFPFGKIPYYGAMYNLETGEYDYSIDAEKYDITVDGVPVEKEIRYTLAGYFDDFDIESDLPQIKDEYAEDKFYSPLLTVTKYYYEVTGLEENSARSAYASFTYKGDYTKNRLWLNNNGAKVQKDGISLGDWANNNGRTFEVYVIGAPLTEELDWTIYEDGSQKTKIEGDVILRSDKIDTMTFEEFVYTSYFGEYQRENGISQFDWYNAVVYSLNECLDEEYGYIEYARMNAQTQFMRWYQYEIEIPAKTKIINVVTAPMYPSINARYEPAIHGYTYLLSPAKTWKSFGDLDIEIHTPYYLVDDSFGFTKTDFGYALSLEGLPDKELEFTLSASESPTYTQNSGCGTTWLYIIMVPLAFIEGGCEAVGCSSSTMIGGVFSTSLLMLILLWMKRRK